MKIKKRRLKEIVREVVEEAAKEGHLQKIYRLSFAKMIDKAASGGNKNTPPFTKKAAKPGKSGPPLAENSILSEEVEDALSEGKMGEWLSQNAAKLKPDVQAFKQSLASGVEPFTIAVQKWKAGKPLSPDEKKNFIKALANAGIMLLPGGSMILVLKHLVVNQTGGVA
tara:strand:- start:9096 stop:9599 length:504 start_codon:yes stop_codon:yes gene_type:complete